MDIYADDYNKLESDPTPYVKYYSKEDRLKNF